MEQSAEEEENPRFSTGTASTTSGTSRDRDTSRLEETVEQFDAIADLLEEKSEELRAQKHPMAAAELMEGSNKIAAAGDAIALLHNQGYLSELPE